MQLQIECDGVPLQQQSCLICNRLFRKTQARIILCDDRGKDHGEICSTCLEKGFYWLNHQFENSVRGKEK